MGRFDFALIKEEEKEKKLIPGWAQRMRGVGTAQTMAETVKLKGEIGEGVETAGKFDFALKPVLLTTIEEEEKELKDFETTYESLNNSISVDYNQFLELGNQLEELTLSLQEAPEELIWYLQKKFDEVRTTHNNLVDKIKADTTEQQTVYDSYTTAREEYERDVDNYNRSINATKEKVEPFVPLDFSSEEVARQLKEGTFTPYKKPDTLKTVLGAYATLGKALSLLPKSAKITFLQAAGGMEVAGINDTGKIDDLLKEMKDIDEFIEEAYLRYGSEGIFGLKITDLAELAQNLGFSVTSMSAFAAAAIPVGLIPFPGSRIAAWAAGTAASGLVAYRATEFQIMQSYLEFKNEESIRETGKPINVEEEKLLKEMFKADAVSYALWEAIPEALSNLNFGMVLTKPLSKVAGKKAASFIIDKLGRVYLGEFSTEMITQMGQSGIEVKAGMRAGPPPDWTNPRDYMEALKEIAPATFLLTTVMGAAGAGVVGTAKGFKQITKSLKAEVGENYPLYKILEAKLIAKLVSQRGSFSWEDIKKTTQRGIDLLREEAKKYKSVEEFIKAQFETEVFYIKVRGERVEVIKNPSEANRRSLEKEVKKTDLAPGDEEDLVKGIFDNYGSEYIFRGDLAIHEDIQRRFGLPFKFLAEPLSEQGRIKKLTDLYNEVVVTPIVEVEEARKYKSAEEYVKAQFETEVFYMRLGGDNVEVIKNPSETDYKGLEKEIKEAGLEVVGAAGFEFVGEDVREIYDSQGNRYIFRGDIATHGDVVKWFKREGIDFGELGDKQEEVKRLTTFYDRVTTAPTNIEKAKEELIKRGVREEFLTPEFMKKYMEHPEIQEVEKGEEAKVTVSDEEALEKLKDMEEIEASAEELVAAAEAVEPNAEESDKIKKVDVAKAKLVAAMKKAGEEKKEAPKEIDGEVISGMFYGERVGIIQNPSEADYRGMRKEVKERYKLDPENMPPAPLLVRELFDDKGNVYIFPGDVLTHEDVIEWFDEQGYVHLSDEKIEPKIPKVPVEEAAEKKKAEPKKVKLKIDIKTAFALEKREEVETFVEKEYGKKIPDKELVTLGPADDWIIDKKLRAILKDVLDTQITVTEKFERPTIHGEVGKLPDGKFQIQLKRDLTDDQFARTLVEELLHVVEEKTGKIDYEAEQLLDYLERPTEKKVKGKVVSLLGEELFGLPVKKISKPVKKGLTDKQKRYLRDVLLANSDDEEFEVTSWDEMDDEDQGIVRDMGDSKTLEEDATTYLESQYEEVRGREVEPAVIFKELIEDKKITEPELEKIAEAIGAYTSSGWRNIKVIGYRGADFVRDSLKEEWLAKRGLTLKEENLYKKDVSPETYEEYIDIMENDVKYFQENNRLLEKFISVAPKYSPGTIIYRGIQLDASEIATWKKGKVLDMMGISSWSKSELRARKHGWIIFRMSNKNAVDISLLSSYYVEEELLESQNMRFKIIDHVELEEVSYIDVEETGSEKGEIMVRAEEEEMEFIRPPKLPSVSKIPIQGVPGGVLSTLSKEQIKLIKRNARKRVTAIKKIMKETTKKQKAVDLKTQVKNDKRMVKRLRESIKKAKETKEEVKTIKQAIHDYAKDMPLSIRGKVLTALKTAATLLDLNAAMTKIDEQVEAYHRKQYIRVIEKELTAKKIAPKKGPSGILKGKFTAEIQRALDIIKGGIHRSRIEALIQIEENIKSFEDGETTDIAGVNELLNMQGIKEMTLDDLESTLDNIKTLKETGKTLKAEKEAIRKEALQEKVNKTIETVIGEKLEIDEETGKPKLDTAYKTISKAKWSEKGLLGRAKKAIDKFMNWQFAWDNLLDKLSALDKTSNPYESELSKIGFVIQYARIAQIRGVEETITKLQEAFSTAYKIEGKKDILNRIGEHKKDINLGTFKNAEGHEVELVLNKEQIMKKYMQLEDPTLDSTFTKGMLYTDEIKEVIRGAITEEDKAYINELRGIYDTVYEKVNPIYMDLYGVDLPRNPHYSGRIVREGKENDNIPENLLQVENAIHYASVLNPSLKQRSRTLSSLKYNEATPDILRYTLQMEHFVAFAKPLQELRGIFGNSAVKAIIKQGYGDSIYRKITDYLQDITRDAVDSANVIALVDKLRGNLTRSILAKPIIGIKQVPSILAYMTEMPTADFFKGIANFWKNPISNYRLLMELSPYAKERFGKGFERDIHFAMRQGWGNILAGAHKFSDIFFVHIRMGDKLAVVQGMWAKMYSETGGRGLKAGRAEVIEGFRSAERSTERTQPTYTIESLAAGQRGGSFLKLLTMFQVQINKYYRIIADNARNFRYGRGSRIKAASNIVLAWVVLPLLFQLIGSAGRIKDKDLYRILLIGPLNDVLVFGQMARSVYGWLAGDTYDYQVSPVVSTMKELQKTIAKIVKWTDPTKDMTTEDFVKMVEYAAKAVGQMTGMPTPYGVQLTEAAREGDWRQVLWSPYALKEEEEAKKAGPVDMSKIYETMGIKKGKEIKGKIPTKAIDMNKIYESMGLK